MNQRLGLIIDQERCIGCEACTVACRKENNGQSGWIRVKTQNSPFKDTPVGTFPNVSMHFLPTLCNHCEQPSCADACPSFCLKKYATDVKPVWMPALTALLNSMTKKALPRNATCAFTVSRLVLNLFVSYAAKVRPFTLATLMIPIVSCQNCQVLRVHSA